MDKNLNGLTDEQVAESKEKFGTNALAKKETESLLSMFLGAFDDIWIKVLCGALAIKIVLAIIGIFVPSISGGNDVIEIVSILIAIGLSTGFSTISEYKNSSRSEALQEEYSRTYAKVMRNGKLVNILTSDIVKGDVVLIQAGDKIPVDGILIKGNIKVIWTMPKQMTLVQNLKFSWVLLLLQVRHTWLLLSSVTRQNLERLIRPSLMKMKKREKIPQV
jgi:magnesium-transporting ATPase (P-type)